MLTINNNSAYTLSTSAQQAIRNGAANAGAESVTAIHSNGNTDDAPIFDIYGQDENYLFSIDTDGDVIFEK